MPDGLYETDALAWAEQQARLLRRLATGERLNEVVDWAHVIEEVQDVGLSELRACQSLLLQAMIHLLKLHAQADSQAASHWRDEAGTFLDDAGLRFTGSMRQRIGIDGLYAKAVRRAAASTGDSVTLGALPQACPWDVEELLMGDVPVLLGKLGDYRQP